MTMTITATGATAGGSSVVTAEWLREQLLRLHAEVLQTESEIGQVASSIEDGPVSRLWSARAVDWHGTAAAEFRAECLNLEYRLGVIASNARLAFAGLADARATIEAELAGLAT